MTHEIITQDGGDTYAFTATGSTVDFTAPASNQGGSLREFYWDPTSVFYADQESCNRWDTVMDESTPEAVASLTRADEWQPGVGLRIAPTPDGTGIRGISVNLNIYGEAFWTLWVNLWDSTKASPFQPVQNIDVSSLVGPANFLYAPPPWNECAQAFGNKVRVKLWLGNNPEPAWTDSSHVFTVTLPDGWDYAGYPGGYVAHIAPGATQQITTLRTGALMPDGSTPTTTVPSTTAAPTTTITPATTIPPTTVPPATTIPPTTVPPATTIPPTTVPQATTIPPTTVP